MAQYLLVAEASDWTRRFGNTATKKNLLQEPFNRTRIAHSASSEPTNKSWRVDETYVRIGGHWFYLYRAVDSSGATIDFFLSAVRSAEAAKALFSKSLSDRTRPQPRVINTDKARCYPLAISEAKHQSILRRRCRASAGPVT